MSTTTTPAALSYDARVASVPVVSAPRLLSLDVVRGVAMLLMAIDHVRVYSGVPAGSPVPAVFFTRWITHFVAPTFVFLAGTSAYLHGQKLGSRGALARFLVTRGLWLVALELTVLRVAWTFNLDFAHYMLAGVIWMLGLCMVLMAGLIFLPIRAIAAFALVVIAGHNLLGAAVFNPAVGEVVQRSAWGWLGQILYLGGNVTVAGHETPLVILYVLVPWIGVMAAGYAFGPVMRLPARRRRELCVALGAAAVALFVALRTIDGYGDPRHWQAHPAFLSFLNTTKYPASLDFLLMTLGPMLLLLAAVERARGVVARTIAVFGRVPLFYYLLHIPLIHTLALLVSLVRTGRPDPWLFANHPLLPPPPPDGYTWSLPLLYLVTAVAIALLYFPCRWYADAKRTGGRWWYRYL